jgi:molecular chaperone GrpE
VTRRTPEESAVREQLRDRDQAGDRETTTDGAGAAAEAAAPPGTPEEVGEQPVAGGQPEPEGEAPADAAQEGEAEDEAPRDPLAEAEAKRDEYLDLARRTQADFENYRKRTAQQAAQAGERAKAGLLRELLPVVDNLERALAAAADSEGPLHEGVKLVLADLQGVLGRAGVEALEPAGERFDPNVHEALSTMPVEGTEAGQVVEVVEKGYRTRDTVIRPARVVVSA